MTNQPNIIFEDNHLLVLDKPSGWIVNEAGTTGVTPVIQTWLRKNFEYPLVESRKYRSGVVHRLDKETSGILIVAKNLSAFRNIQSQFKNRGVMKEYCALVHGKVEPMLGEIKVSVGRLPWNRERFGIVPGGRESETGYKLLAYYTKSTTKPASHFSLLKLYPKTGRTHQIRIHMKYLGHSIVSDEFYAGRKIARDDRTWCPRLFLHASKISFKHPKSEKMVSFNSELESQLKNALSSLEKVSQTP